MKLLATLSATLLLAACSIGSAAPTPTPSPVPVPPEASQAVDAALQDAAGHLSVSRDQLQVSQVAAQQWNDAALGCPQPGQLYSQIVTPGFLVMITSGSRQLEYHTDTRGRVTLCHET
jgi:hypothetical protein